MSFQVQAIFGAFLVGLIIPREGGLCIALTEKLEDMVQVIFLPLVRFPHSLGTSVSCLIRNVEQYFTLSGLNTNLTLLNDGAF